MLFRSALSFITAAWSWRRNKVLVYRGDGGRRDRKVWQAFVNGAPVMFDGEVLVKDD
ncbi:hypothetical protein X732_11730 [Mesorhizobium sp. L2C066B000]|nr:hypothetical protein X732_11730 [Mesorhizobium sp. L2C066B000]